LLNLAIETSAGVCSCALLNNDETILELTQATKSQQETLMLLIEELYDKTGIDKMKTELVSVDLGPGAFTALRIGVATAKSLAYAFNASISGISSHDALYHESLKLTDRPCDRVILIDAKRKKMFTAIYRANGDFLNNLDLNIQDVLYLVKDREPVIFLGAGAELYRDEINIVRGEAQTIILDFKEENIHASIIGKLGYSKYISNGGDNVFTIVPHYVRDSETVTKGK
jgi:tRNA threonylcarbamoyladenosine biosynthesis protein TsaB